MPPNSVDTPKYVLIDKKQRIGPKLATVAFGFSENVIYGFSSKSTFDRFCENSPLALTPFPLVKTFLMEQISMVHPAIPLIAIDAIGPTDTSLRLATMQAVLAAQEQRAVQVATSHLLVLEPRTCGYQLESQCTATADRT